MTKDEIQKQVAELRAATAFLDVAGVKANNTHRKWCLANNLLSELQIPKCPGCGGYSKFNFTDHHAGFRIFCSQACNSAKKRIPADAVAKLADYDWLYNERIVKRTAIKAIGKNLGCSEEPVRVALEKFGIERANARMQSKSAELSLKHLHDAEWMKDQYLVKLKRARQIAEDLKLSTQTVYKWLHIHNIELRHSTEYQDLPARPSAECLTVVDFIKTFYSGEIILDANILPGKFGGRQLDIYIPEKNFAIEYNGLFSHLYRPNETSQALIKGPDYHSGKIKEANELGIDLLMIWSDQWKLYRGACESIIKHKLGCSSQRHYARSLEIGSCTTQEKDQFLNKNHIQGACTAAKYIYCLRYDNQLVAVMTFAKARFSNKADWELMRYATVADTAIVGGFSRLLAAFRKEHTGSIVSYSDTSYSKGSVYEKNGFVLDKVNRPVCWYVKLSEYVRKSQSSFQKKKIQSGPNDLRTTPEIMDELGYERIWNCGTKTWILE